MDASYIFFFLMVSILPVGVNHCEVKLSDTAEKIVIDKREDFWYFDVPNKEKVKMQIKGDSIRIYSPGSEIDFDDKDMSDVFELKGVDWAKTEKLYLAPSFQGLTKIFLIERKEKEYLIRFQIGEEQKFESILITWE